MGEGRCSIGQRVPRSPKQADVPSGSALGLLEPSALPRTPGTVYGKVSCPVTLSVSVTEAEAFEVGAFHIFLGLLVMHNCESDTEQIGFTNKAVT